VVFEDFFKVHLILMCLYSTIKKNKTPNTYANNMAGCDNLSACHVPNAIRPASAAKRSAMPPPKAHQNALNDPDAFATRSAIVPIVDDAHATEAPIAIERGSEPSDHIARAAAINSAPPIAASAALLAAVLAARCKADELKEPKSNSEQSAKQR
jgi:hypothetical protein